MSKTHEEDTSVKILSDLTVYMKYARFLPEKKRRETWEELVDRNKNMHIKNFPGIKEQIEEAYKFVYDKKVLPSMRSMQFAGAPIEKNPVRIYNCFSEDTEFITSKGVFSFEDFDDGDEVEVLTHKGNWKNAVVRNYGKQMLNKIKIVRGRSRYEVKATGNHRWILRDGAETTELKVGDKLFPAPPLFDDFDYEESNPVERMYWAYGYIFGDGTKIKNKKGEYTYSMVRLCGNDKNKYLDRFMELGFSNSSSASLNEDVIVYTGKYLKNAPDVEKDSPNLIRAFVRGYLDADGAKNTDPTMISSFSSILSTGDEHKYVVEKLFPVAGVFVTSFQDYSGQETNYGIRGDSISYRINTNLNNKTNMSFSVKEVSEFEEQEVWCLEVEGDKSFVLANGIATGNCSFLPAEHPDTFPETMYLLLSGTGVGYSVQKQHVRKLPPLLGSTHPEGRQRKKRYLIGDSIEGWSDAVKVLVESYFYGKREIDFDFSDIRPKGSKLITSGGKAPGPEPLRQALVKIQSVFENAIQERGRGTHLKPIEVHDIQCHIADAVLAGGIRRAAMISLFSFDDKEMLTSKSGRWWEHNPERGRANNSAVAVKSRITKKDFDDFWNYVEMSKSGEPGIFFTDDRDGNWGLNPCAEISLRPYQFCNLSTINASDIESQQDLNERSAAAAFIGTLQAAYTNFHYLRDVWQETTEKEALTGVSMTGIGSGEVLKYDLEEAARAATLKNEEVANILGIRKAARITAIKPEGTASLTLGTSSGIHGWWDPYYIRTIRIGKNEPIFKYLERELPDLLEDEKFKPDTISVLSIPQKAPENAIYRHESPIETLERVKKFNTEWVRAGHRDGVNKNNVSCFSGDTKFLTKDFGYKRFDSFNDGDETEVLTYDGSFTKGLVKNFGKQKIWELDVSYGGSIKTIRTTEHHLWFYLNNYKRYISGRTLADFDYNLGKTKDLLNKKKAQLPRVFFGGNKPKLNHEALLHGIVFGDGTRHKQKNDLGGSISLCEKSRELKKYFLAEGYEAIEHNEKDQTYIGRLPYAWKDLPSTNDPSYIYSFIAGWFAADGYISKDKRVITITSVNRENIEWLKDNAPIAKIGTSPFIMKRIGDGYNKDTVSYALSFVKSTLDDSFFILDYKLENWKKHNESVQSEKYFSVVDVRQTEDYEDVWCVIEPKNAAFVIDGNILTHNCTINVKDDEWDEVGKWMWKNRDYYTAIAVLPYDGGSYVQAPFQTIDEKTYKKMYKRLQDIDLTKVIEEEDETDLQGELACAGGACVVTGTVSADENARKVLPIASIVF